MANYIYIIVIIYIALQYKPKEKVIKYGVNVVVQQVKATSTMLPSKSEQQCVLSADWPGNAAAEDSPRGRPG